MSAAEIEAVEFRLGFAFWGCTPGCFRESAEVVEDARVSKGGFSGVGKCIEMGKLRSEWFRLRFACDGRGGCERITGHVSTRVTICQEVFMG